MKNTYLALDFGGTKLLIGEVDSDGEVFAHKSYETGYIDQSEALEVIKSSLDDYISSVGFVNDRAPQSMGVGLIGRVDNANGVWLQMDPKRDHTLSLAEELSNIYNIPCYIDNDVKSATRAEKMWGSGRESKDFIYINIGTGIAAGFIINDQLVRGSHFNSGEVGHTNVGVDVGVKCGCGRDNCVELIAAGIGFDRCARLFKDNYKTELTISPDENIRVDVREVYALYREGDELCQVLVDNAAKAIAGLIMNLVRCSDPDTVVLGGGIVSNEFMYSEILANLNATTIRFVTNGVVLTELNPSFIGLLGAAAVAMNR